MSQTTSIDFDLSESINVKDFLSYLEEQGWTIAYNGQITYLPFGDDDMFAWKAVSSTDTELVFDELQKKALSNECIGVVLMDKETDTGGELLIWSDYKSFSLSLSVKFNDPQPCEYYIGKIKDLLEGMGVKLLSSDIGTI